jgi:hypothetical protein
MIDEALGGLMVPTRSERCSRCDHVRTQHGQDARDTSCTECTCTEFKPPRMPSA